MTPDIMNPKSSALIQLTQAVSTDGIANEKPDRKVHSRRRLWLWSIASIALLLYVFSFVINRTPSLFDVRTHIENSGSGSTVSGAATTGVVIKIVDTLLNKTGGYISNDVTPPMVLLDNMPNWEFGALVEIRDAVRAMRNDFSRAKSQSAEDSDLSAADTQFHFDHTHWVLPATEDEFEKGRLALDNYLSRLQSGDAQFFPRADNLNFYLATVEKRLGNLSQRLGESVREPFLRELISNYDNTPGTQTPTPWLEIDDVFFEARGYAWALLHILKAIEIDFAAVLKSKNADVLLQQIIHNLENTQHMLLSPMIFNSTGFGVLTNHSLIMASYISRANAAVIDLRLQLTQG